MPTDKQYLVLNSPEPDEAGAYYLITARAGLGGGGAQTVHVVDGLSHEGVGDAAYIQGWVNGPTVGRIVVEFPAVMPYLMIERKRAVFMTPEEAATAQRESDERFTRAWKALDDNVQPLTQASVPSPGQYI